MSSETKFTKGDWKINHTGPHWNNPELANIEITYSDIGECICDTVYRIEDAHLIKTAPKLYSAIEALINRGVELMSIDEIEDEEDAAAVHSDFNDVVILAKKFLAEARGE